MPVTQPLPDGPYTVGTGTPGQDAADLVAFLTQKGTATDAEMQAAIAAKLDTAALGTSVAGLADGFFPALLARDSETAAAVTAETTARNAALAGKLDTTVASATYVAKGAQTLYASDYVSLATALAAATAGTTVVLTGSVTTTGVTIPDDVTVQAQGRALVTMLTGGAGSVFTLGNRSRLVGARIDCANVTGKNGVAVPSGVADAVVSDIIVSNSPNAAFRGDTAARPTFLNCSSVTCKYGVLLNGTTTDALVVGGSHRLGTAATSFEGSLYIPNAVRARVIGVTVESAAGHGAWIGGASTADILVEGCTFRACGTAGGAADWRGVTVDGNINRVRFVGCLFDGNYECGAFTTTTAFDVDFIGCTARGNNTGLRPGGHGFEINGRGRLSACLSEGTLGSAAESGNGFFVGDGGASVVNSVSRANWSSGIRVFNSFQALVHGCRVYNNSQRGVNLHDGIQLWGGSAGASTDCSIIGNRCYDTQATKTQRYGISTNANVDWFVITGNSTRGNATGGIDNSTGGANKVFANNLAA